MISDLFTEYLGSFTLEGRKRPDEDGQGGIFAGVDPRPLQAFDGGFSRFSLSGLYLYHQKLLVIPSALIRGMIYVPVYYYWGSGSIPHFYLIHSHICTHCQILSLES